MANGCILKLRMKISGWGWAILFQPAATLGLITEKGGVSLELFRNKWFFDRNIVYRF